MAKNYKKKSFGLHEFEIELSGAVAGEIGSEGEPPIVVQAKNKKAALKTLDLPEGVKVKKVTQTE